MDLLNDDTKIMFEPDISSDVSNFLEKMDREPIDTKHLGLRSCKEEILLRIRHIYLRG